MKRKDGLGLASSSALRRLLNPADSLFEKVLWSLAWTEARDAHFSADLVEGLLLRIDPNFLFEVDGDLNAGRGDLFNGVFHIQNLFSFCN